MLPPTMRPIVTIIPTERPHHEAIRKHGPWFWMRETNNGYARLIPINQETGIPYVADFIFVESKDIRYTDTPPKLQGGQTTRGQ